MVCSGERSPYFTAIAGFFVFCVVASYGRVACDEWRICPSQCVCDFDIFVANCSSKELIDVFEVARDRSFNWTESLDLSGNLLSTVTEETLSGFPSLLDLSLAGNRVQDIANGSFRHLAERLHRLVLGGNMLVEIPPAIRELRVLRELDLSTNRLWYISPGSFEGLDMLESLYLDHNTIDVFDGAAFHGLTSLNKLSLMDTFLAEDPVGWFVDSPLRELHLSHNAVPLSSEVRSWFDLNKTAPLEILVLINNEIEKVEGRFRGMVNLMKLDLGTNKIRKITEESMEGLFNLKELIMNSNSLELIDKKSFQNMFDLQILSIDENQLASLLAGLFSRSNRLTRLNAGQNNLEDISAITDEYLPEMRELYLYSNSIQKISSQGFTSLPVLSHLVLGGNLLTHVPNVRNLPELQSLDLSQNQIRFVPANAFEGSFSLEEIYLEQNQLEHLQYEPFAELFYLVKLSLVGNPWWCDCQIEWMLELMYTPEQPYWVEDLYDVLCVKPPELIGFSLTDVTRDDLVFRCPNPLDRNTILVLLGSWFGLVLLVLLRFWIRKFCRVRKREKIGKRNVKYHRRRERRGSNGIFGSNFRGRRPIDRSDSYALILQNKDNDEQDGCGSNPGNGDVSPRERIEIARVTTV
ncbi:chondroadherin-like protein [Acanthaster planci]|uniref:Chondroadherin-like protein n=1 Tax=Acanthaster planci TaxID=133434 RepID=A0A8B7ZIK2_ACAPL|nr:chondroadherin-like protein [Acanthaster planci]